jgi:hypothetical protein
MNNPDEDHDICPGKAFAALRCHHASRIADMFHGIVELSGTMFNRYVSSIGVHWLENVSLY